MSPFSVSPLLVALLLSGVSGQTPFCGEFLGTCNPTDNNGYCCPTCPSDEFASINVAGTTTTCLCVAGCAIQANSTTAVPPAAWLQNVPTTRVTMSLLGASIQFYTTATLVTASQIASPTSATNKNWPSGQWAYISIQLHDSGTGGPVGLPIMYQITPFTLSASYTLQFAADPSDSFTLTLTVMPSDCGQAGVQDADSCNQYCAFVNSATGGLVGATTGSFDGAGGCTCGSGASVVACAAPTTTSTTSTASTAASTASTTVGSSGGSTSDSSTGGSSRLAAGAEAGIVIGIVAAIVIVAGAVFVFRRRNKAGPVSWSPPASAA